MKVLLIHTCGVEGTVAAADTEGAPVVRGTAVLPARTSSETVMPGVRAVLEEAGWRVGDVGAVGVVTGPGSFTGVRTGLSVGKGLCEVLGIPLIGVSRLALLAARVGVGGRVWALLDAGRGEFYVGEYSDGRCVGETLEDLDAVKARLAAGGRAAACEAKVLEALAGMGVEAREEPRAEEALHAVVEGLREGRNDVLEDANYLRRTDAEIFAKPLGAKPVAG